MKHTYKRITALALSLALAASNAGTILPGQFVLKANAAAVTAKQVQGKDESYYDAETQTLHLKGYVRNGRNGSGLILPDGVKGEDVVELIADEGTVFPEDCSHFFASLDSCLGNVDLRNADTSNVTDMSYMFYCPSKDSYHLYYNFDISTFDTSNVTNMEGMFMNCSGIFCNETGGGDNFINFDTSKVTNMSKMFAGAGYAYEPLGYWDVQNDKPTFASFDTSSVTDMSEMFAGANIMAINLSNFDTSSVTTMARMFEGGWRIQKIDISNFDTSNVTDMSRMFNNAYNWVWGSGPDEVDLSSFNTSKVTDMSLMFNYTCIQSLDLSSFDTSNVTNMRCMFNNSSYLGFLDVSSFDTSNVTDMASMFCGCTSLRNLDVSSFDTSKVMDMSLMFSSIGICELDIRNFVISDDTNVNSMFVHSTKYGGDLTYITLPYGWTKDRFREKDYYIFACYDDADMYIWEEPDDSYYDADTQTLHLKGHFINRGSRMTVLSSGVSKNDIKYVVADKGTVLPENCNYMFRDMEKLESIDLQNADTSNIAYIDEMFANCRNLRTIYVGSGCTFESAYGNDLFTDCTSLVGGAGTVYNANHVNKDYAHVDGGRKNPGYLTLKDDKNDFIKTHNLVLSGQIGVSFNLDLSSLTDKEKAASYMEFTVNGKTSKAEFNKDSMSPSGKYYSFTCYVTSVEMADMIKAVFHFGNGNTISETYSVLEYINKVEKDSGSYDKSTLDLIHAIADYGHYAQPFLAANNNWRVGGEHKIMARYFTSSYSYEDVSKAASKYERVLALGKSDIEKITYSLSLNTDTTVNVFIKPRSSYSGSVKITTRKGNTATSYTAAKQADGRYKVTIPNISAHQLGDTYTITAVTANGTASCKVSALSYVNAILNENSSTIAKNAVSAFYRYYEAIMIYRENL